MKVKTSITLSDYILKKIDKLLGNSGNRSIFIEAISKILIVRSPIHSYDDRHKWRIHPVAQIVNSDGILWRLLEHAAFFPDNSL